MFAEEREREEGEAKKTNSCFSHSEMKGQAVLLVGLALSVETE